MDIIFNVLFGAVVFLPIFFAARITHKAFAKKSFMKILCWISAGIIAVGSLAGVYFAREWYYSLLRFDTIADMVYEKEETDDIEIIDTLEYKNYAIVVVGSDAESRYDSYVTYCDEKGWTYGKNRSSKLLQGLNGNTSIAISEVDREAGIYHIVVDCGWDDTRNDVLIEDSMGSNFEECFIWGFTRRGTFVEVPDGEYTIKVGYDSITFNLRDFIKYGKTLDNVSNWR